MPKCYTLRYESKHEALTPTLAETGSDLFPQIMADPPGRVMNIDKMKWINGWPYIGIASDTPQPVPATRKSKKLKASN